MEPTATPPDNQPSQTTTSIAARRFSELPRSKRFSLIAGAGLVIAVLVGGSAWLLSAGDGNSSQSRTSQGGDAANASKGTATGATPQSPAANTPGQNGQSATAGGAKTDDGKAAPASNPPASAVNTTPSAAATITMAGMAFSPSTLTVAANTTVTWRNDDNVAHAIDKAAGQSSGPHSPQLQPGTSYSYSFASPGTYKYICVIHPSMSGTVVVK